MRPGAVCSEVWRNISSGTTRTALWAVLFAAIVGALTCVDVAAANDVLTDARTYRDAGASVITLTASGRIDATACDALADLPGVNAAGALRTAAAPIVASALPRAPIPTVEISPGATGLFDVETDAGAGGVLLSRDAADTLGVGAGGTFQTTRGGATVRAVYDYPDDGRRAGYRYAALVLTHQTTGFDECWVDAWPAPEELSTLIRTTLEPDTGADTQEQPVLSQLNTTLGIRFDGQDRFLNRATRHAPLGGLLAGLALGYAAGRARRLELASAQHGGITRTAQLIQMLAEAASWIFVCWALIAPAVAALITAGAPQDVDALRDLALRTPTSASLAALVGVGVATAMTRERHLFAYFKNR